MTDAAFEAAVERCGDMVFRLAYSYLKNRADAEDVMQETLLKLYVQPPFDTEEHRRYWVVRVAVNQCKRLLRSPWRRRTGPLEDLPPAAPSSGVCARCGQTGTRLVTRPWTGSAEAWEMTETVTGSDGTTYTNRLTSEDPEVRTGTAVVRESGGDGGFVTVTENEARDPLVEDETVESWVAGRFSVEPRPAAEAP